MLFPWDHCILQDQQKVTSGTPGGEKMPRETEAQNNKGRCAHKGTCGSECPGLTLHTGPSSLMSGPKRAAGPDTPKAVPGLGCVSLLTEQYWSHCWQRCRSWTSTCALTHLHTPCPHTRAHRAP